MNKWNIFHYFKILWYKFQLFESQELTFALLPVCIMAVILKNVSLTSIWMFTINPASIPIPCVLLVFYSVRFPETRLLGLTELKVTLFFSYLMSLWSTESPM